jgi:D-alanyl-lipoteichoic acid acyltransferase DltB (MBOAT superfamily)
MLFNSWEFIFYFLPATVAGYALLRRFSSAHVGIAFLALASMMFYLWWDIHNLGVLIGAILVSYAFGRVMVFCHARGEGWQSVRKAALIAGIVFNIGLLFFYKYTNFFAGQLGLDVPHIILPLGISFFTFQKITYLVDCYNGVLTEAGITEFALFVAYFPHAIAGPIVHHRDMMPQFLHPQPPVRPDTVQEGLIYLAVGLAQKVLVADNFAPFATQFFSAARDGAPIHLLDAWVGVLSYTMQIYFDFSGYSAMAIGASLLLGIRLPINFDSPYKSLSIIEFWRRWHMTLSRFLREYIYFPLGGSRRGAVRHYVNLMIVMLVGGFWHGAGWTFIVWGGLHGLYLLVNHAWRRATELGRGIALPRALSWVVTFGSVVVAWAFFRADSVGVALRIVKAMLGVDGIALPIRERAHFGALAVPLEHLGVSFVPDTATTLTLLATLAVVVATGACLALPNVHALAQRIKAMPPALGSSAAAVLGVLAAAAVLRIDQPSEFLYFNF